MDEIKLLDKTFSALTVKDGIKLCAGFVLVRGVLMGISDALVPRVKRMHEKINHKLDVDQELRDMTPVE